MLRCLLMPNLLTESWGGIYLQIMVGLLVFALGIPALILQISMPPDVQRVAMRRGGQSTGLMFGMMLFYVALACLFMWVFHPWQRGKVATLTDWIAGGSVTAALLLTIGLWWQQSKWNVREKLIRRLELRLLPSYPTSIGALEGSNKLADLIYLGQKGDSGHDKELAIQAICRLSRYIVDLLSYRGNRLQPLIEGLELIASDSDPRPNNENVNSIRRVLIELRARIVDRGYPDSADEAVVLRTLGRLGVTAAKEGDLSNSLMFVEALSDCAESLFEIGIAALQSDRSLIALSAFRKLSDGTRFVDSDIHEQALLGLAAHFWAATETGKQVIEAELRSKFLIGLPISLAGAVDYFRGTGAFATADLLKHMQANL